VELGEQLSIDDVVGTIRIGPEGGAPVNARAEIARLHDDGLGFTAIARSLNARRVPTPSGRGLWWASTCRRHVDPTGWRDYIRSYRAAQR
jgi:hypothetical protein